MRIREKMPLLDAFDRFKQWANKPLDSHETISAELHHAVTSLPSGASAALRGSARRPGSGNSLCAMARPAPLRHAAKPRRFRAFRLPEVAGGGLAILYLYVKYNIPGGLAERMQNGCYGLRPERIRRDRQPRHGRR
jgi:hypothetical protein